MEWGVPNTPETKFRIGSVTKQFTSTIVMRLVQAGKMTLQAKVTDYLPWYRKDTGSQITVHELLTHTSGIPNFTSDAQAIGDIDTHSYTFREVAEKYCSGNLEYEPGTKFVYDNSDYYLLGLIIEAVSGKSYEQNLKDEILTPLQMKDSGIDRPTPLLPKRAAGYDYSDGGYQNIYYINPEPTTYAAGAMYSTVDDLNRWAKALFAGRMLTAESQATLLKPFLGKYAYGFYVNAFTPKGAKKAVTVIGHNGGIPGFSSSVLHFVEDDITIILTDNTTVHHRGNLENISVGILRVLLNLTQLVS